MRSTALRLLAAAIALATAGCREAGAEQGMRPPGSVPPGPVGTCDRRGEVTVVGTGDLLVHRRVLESARAHGGFGYVFEGLRRAVDEVDGGRAIVVTNLETPLTEAYTPPVNALPPTLGSPPEVAQALAEAGVDVVSLANNHALDQTAAGLHESLATARSAGLETIGAGSSADQAWAAAVVERGSIKVAFVGLAQFVNKGLGVGARAGAYVASLREDDPVRRALAEARERADVVVAVPHWNGDFSAAPTPRLERLAERMVAWGADVILAAGPHVLHRVERIPSPRGQAVVAYSLGNLVSNQGLHHKVGERRREGHPIAVDPRTRDAVLLAVRLQLEPGGAIAVTAIEAVPMWTANNFWERRSGEAAVDDIRIVRLIDAGVDVREERGRAIARALGSDVRLLF